MGRSLVRATPVGGDVYLIEELSRPTDPGFGRPGGGWEPVDPGFGSGRPDRPDQGLPWAPGHPGNRPPGSSPGHPGNALPVPPLRPSTPIVLPPGMWPPALPPGIDNTLPGVPPEQPVVIPPDPSIGIDQPIYLPQLPAGSALLIALTGAHMPQPKGDAPAPPPNSKPAILWQGAGTKPVLVYVSTSPK
jgi:hypothetical protein